MVQGFSNTNLVTYHFDGQGTMTKSYYLMRIGCMEVGLRRGEYAPKITGVWKVGRGDSFTH